jgi:hypothetical protein
MSSEAIRETARRFVTEAFRVLQAEHVIPPPVFHPFVHVGRDYYGPHVMGSAYEELAEILQREYPARFSEPLNRPEPEFPVTYALGLLEMAVAACSRDGDFRPTSDGVERAITRLVEALDQPDYEIVCCRVVSHLTTTTGAPVTIGDITITPESDRGVRTFESMIGQEVAGGVVAFNRDPPFAWDPPHSMLTVRARTHEPGPFDVVFRLSEKLERFLLHVRLLAGASIRSFYEVRGPGQFIGRISPNLVAFPLPRTPSQVRRTARLDGSETAMIEGIADLIDQAEVKQEGMARTSFAVALSNFNRSHATDGPLETIVDLATSLEAALAASESDTEGVGLRLRSRAATLLATANDPAEAIFEDIKRLYGLRSRLVHGGALKQKKLASMIDAVSTVPTDPQPMPGVALGHAVDRMRDLARRAILARMCLAAHPDALWPLPPRVVSTSPWPATRPGLSGVRAGVDDWRRLGPRLRLTDLHSPATSSAGRTGSSADRGRSAVESGVEPG